MHAVIFFGGQYYPCVLQLSKGSCWPKTIQRGILHGTHPLRGQTAFSIRMGQLYLDQVVPLVLHSVSLIISAIGDTIECLTGQRGVELGFHYVHDFIVVGYATSNSYSQGRATQLQTWADVGAPVELGKCTSRQHSAPLFRLFHQ